MTIVTVKISTDSRSLLKRFGRKNTKSELCYRMLELFRFLEKLDESDVPDELQEILYKALW